MIRRYSELKNLNNFIDRFKYLKLGGTVGKETFRSDRWVNQTFYTSVEWKRVRDLVITRDEGCDLGIPTFDIHSELTVHHIVPITLRDLLDGHPKLTDPDNLITTTSETHRAIHYGVSNFPLIAVERTSGDTKLW